MTGSYCPCFNCYLLSYFHALFVHMMFSLKSQSFLTQPMNFITNSELILKKKKTASPALTSHAFASCSHRQILTCPVLSAYRIKPLKIPIMYVMKELKEILKIK